MALSDAHAPVRCRFDGDDTPGAPRVFALRAPGALPGDAPEAARALARVQARDALHALLVGEGLIAPDAPPLSNVRGEHPHVPGRPRLGLSISHERAISLLAFCASGAVGVDVAAVDAAADASELRRTAGVFLEPKAAVALSHPAHKATFFIAFNEAWAAHEARLKCIGQPLVEWSPALSARLAGVRASPVELPAWATPGHVAAVAWRAADSG